MLHFDSQNALEQYVNDRPYVASSFLSVAIAKVFSSALAGRCQEFPELALTPIPLTVFISVLPCRGGENFLRQLFEPLGYEVTAQPKLLDDNFPVWGNSVYFSVTLSNTITLSTLLGHLYVLIPVLDDDKHYWVGDEEVDKLLRHGEGWLKEHPQQEEITHRYLKRQRRLTRMALEQLLSEDNNFSALGDEEEIFWEKPISLNQQRLETVIAHLKENQVKRVVDLGCGEGNLLRLLLEDKSFEEIIGVDVSLRALEIAQKKLSRQRFFSGKEERIKLLHSSLIYRDRRLFGYDAATVIEVIEHLDSDRLISFSRILFDFLQPKIVIITTPNIEYNIRFPDLVRGKFRHKDHRFEWTRAEFQSWAMQITEMFAYQVEFRSIGQEDSEVGSPTQMGIFRKNLTRI